MLLHKPSAGNLSHIPDWKYWTVQEPKARNGTGASFVPRDSATSGGICDLLTFSAVVISHTNNNPRCPTWIPTRKWPKHCSSTVLGG